MSAIRLLGGLVLIESGAVALSDDCCCDDPCDCHPELWDWEVVVSGLFCSYLDGTHSHTADSFVAGDMIGDCSVWTSEFNFSQDGNDCTSRLRVWWESDGVHIEYRAWLIINPVLEALYSDTIVSEDCSQPTDVEVTTVNTPCQANLNPIFVTASDP